MSETLRLSVTQEELIQTVTKTQQKKTCLITVAYVLNIKILFFQANQLCLIFSKAQQITATNP